MNAQTLSQMIESKMKQAGFEQTDLNFKLIDIIIESIIDHIKTEAIVQVTTTGNATTQSGIGKIS